MRTATIMLTLLLVGAATLAYRYRPGMQSVPGPAPALEPETVMPTPVPADRAVVPLSESEPVQPIEERGDAMLFEIDALQNTPFTDAITRPFD